MSETIKIKKRNSSNIEDAKIISETKNNSTSTENKIVNAETIGEPTHKLNLDNKQKTKPLATIEITADDKKKIEDEPIEMDFQDEEVLKEFAQQETKQAETTSNGDDKFKGTTEQIRDQILNEERVKSETTSPEDIRKLAKFLINLLDTGISTALKFWSGNDIDTPFSIAESKKNMLADQLTVILIKHSVKFKIEILFIIGIVVAYSGPVGTAMAIRKQKKPKIKQQPPNRTTEPVVVEKKSEVVNQTQPLVNVGTEEPKVIKIKKRRPGHPGKG